MNLTTIKLVNNRYEIPTILKFTLSPFNFTINITKRHVAVFATIKIVDPSVTVISPQGTIFHHHKDFPSNQNLKDECLVISNSPNTRNPHIYVSHTLNSSLTVNNMKFDEKNIIGTLY